MSFPVLAVFYVAESSHRAVVRAVHPIFIELVVGQSKLPIASLVLTFKAGFVEDLLLSRGPNSYSFQLIASLTAPDTLA